MVQCRVTVALQEMLEVGLLVELVLSSNVVNFDCVRRT